MADGRASSLPTGTVTFLFTDIEGSTRLLHALGPERYAGALVEHRRALREAFAYGWIKRMPRLASIQAHGANPFYRSYRESFATRHRHSSGRCHPPPCRPSTLSLDPMITRRSPLHLLAAVLTAFRSNEEKVAAAVAGAPPVKVVAAQSFHDVVLDPNTGGVVAMASWPTFHPSWFVRGLSPIRMRANHFCRLYDPMGS